MPAWTIKDKHANKWALISSVDTTSPNAFPAKIKWTTFALATSYPTRAQAEQAYAQARDAYIDFAHKKSAYVNLCGGKPIRCYEAAALGRGAEWDAALATLSDEQKIDAIKDARFSRQDQKRSLDERFAMHGRLLLPSTPEQFLPGWIRPSFQVELERAPLPDDLLDPMDIYFVRFGAHWLSEGKKVVPNFQEARTFHSKQAALEQAQSCQRSATASIVHARMAFEGIDLPADPSRADAFSHTLYAACEARHIESASAPASAAIGEPSAEPTAFQSAHARPRL
jgi:hypothetical protein